MSSNKVTRWLVGIPIPVRKTNHQPKQAATTIVYLYFSSKSFKIQITSDFIKKLSHNHSKIQ